MKTMKKAALLVGAAVAIMAMALPAAASAARLEDQSGELLEPGTQFTAVSSNLNYRTSLGISGCSEVEANGEVTWNSFGVVKAVETTPGYSKGCFVGGPKSFTQQLELTDLSFESTGVGVAGFSIDIQYPWGKCHLQNDATPVTYVPGSSAIRVTEVAMKATPVACAPFRMTGEFKLADSGGNPLFLN